MAAFGRGDLDQAERLAASVLKRAPRDVAALTVQGLVHNARGQHRDAANAFRRLTELEPAQVAHWVNLGTALRASSKLDDALKAYRQALALGEGSAAFLFNLGMLHLDRLEYVDAHAALSRAAQAAPGDAEIRFYYARACYDCVRNDEACHALADWRRFEGLDTRLLCEIATLFLQLGDTAQAEAAVSAAQTRDPADLRVRLCAIQLAERTNRVAQAQAEYQQIAGMADVELADDVARVGVVLLQRGGNHAAAAEHYERFLGGARTARERADLLFPFAKSLDALGRYDDAFATLERAHADQQEFLRQSAPRFHQPDRDPLEIANFSSDAADVARWDAAGAPSVEDSPIFIVAFPRSGTTLLEQMLDAHPQLRSMDEQPFLQNAIERMQSLGARYPDRLAGLTLAQLDEVRADYWSRAAKEVTLEPGQRLVDKNPLNLLRLPAIRRLFPHSRILLVIRHPCDVVLSCYMQHFRAPDFANLCRRLDGLAAGFTRAFEFWGRQAALLSPPCLELRYEAFVDDVGRHAREIARFLDLPWSDAMLDPAASARGRGFISTPSYAQVVQPVNTRAIGRWRNYAKHFAPVIGALEPQLKRWSYEV
jgi:Flp pilus assembly protein TadD